jgi:peroxiredoxin Q/BCP
MDSQAVDFSLPNVGPEPDPFSLSALPEDVSFVVIFFQRDFYLSTARESRRSRRA